MCGEVHLNTCGGKGLQVGGDVMAMDGKGSEMAEVGVSGFQEERNLGLC